MMLSHARVRVNSKHIAVGRQSYCVDLDSFENFVQMLSLGFTSRLIYRHGLSTWAVKAYCRPRNQLSKAPVTPYGAHVLSSLMADCRLARGLQITSDSHHSDAES